MPPEPQQRASPGLAAFDSLRAEDEPWLDDCFIPPPGVEQVVGERSVVVFGAPGSGKTALYRHLLRRCLGSDGQPKRLVATWRPSPLSPDAPGGLAAVQAQIAQVFDACAMSLLTYLAHYPDRLEATSTLTRGALAWFVHRFSRGDLSSRINQLIAEIGPARRAALSVLLTTPVPDILYPDAPPDQVAAELVRAIARLGLEGVWVMADGLETWAEVSPGELVAGLNAFLSTLSLFERAHFSYKLFVPAQLALASVSGLTRRRLDAYYLRWDIPTLQRLVERRLTLAAGRTDFTLGELCSSPNLLPWLENVGADSPREWLDQVKPLIDYYLSHHMQEPIDDRIWRDLRRQHPPRLYIDEVGQRVTVGARQISLEDVPAKAYDMLCYLSRQSSDRVVSKAELYFLVYRELEHVPLAVGDKDYETPKEYEGLIDTNLWRLRKAIEPDPSDPVLLVTVRGYGVRLKARW